MRRKNRRKKRLERKQIKKQKVLTCEKPHKIKTFCLVGEDGFEPSKRRRNRFTVLTRKKHIKSFACKQKKRISHKVCRTGIFLGVEPEYHRANIKCVFSSELKMRRNREENKAVPINLF